MEEHASAQLGTIARGTLILSMLLFWSLNMVQFNCISPKKCFCHCYINFPYPAMSFQSFWNHFSVSWLTSSYNSNFGCITSVQNIKCESSGDHFFQISCDKVRGSIKKLWSSECNGYTHHLVQEGLQLRGVPAGVRPVRRHRASIFQGPRSSKLQLIKAIKSLPKFLASSKAVDRLKQSSFLFLNYILPPYRI
jgi:hypothetical protein